MGTIAMSSTKTAWHGEIEYSIDSGYVSAYLYTWKTDGQPSSAASSANFTATLTVGGTSKTFYFQQQEVSRTLIGSVTGVYVSGAEVSISARVEAPYGVSMYGYPLTGGDVVSVGSEDPDVTVSPTEMLLSTDTLAIGDSLRILLLRSSISCYHHISYYIGGVYQDLIGIGVETDCDWTVPDLSAKFGASQSLTVTLLCETYLPGNTYGGTYVGETTKELTVTLPRATTPICGATVEMGSKLTIALPRENEKYTHDISYEMEGASGTVASGAGESCTWAVPLSLAKQIPSKTYAGCTITCVTKLNSLEIGMETVSVVLTVPENESTKPAASMTLAPSGELPEGYANMYIRDVTGVKASFTASSEYSQIKSYRLEVDDMSVIGNPAVTAAVNAYGTVTVTGMVTDARGFARTLTQTISVTAYDKPRVIPYAHLLQLQNDVGGTTVWDMTLGQLEQVADAYTMVLTTVRNANKMFAKNLKFKRDTLAGMVMGEIGSAAKKISKLVSPGKDAADRFSWNNLKPVYAFERLGSQTLKTLFSNIRKGQDVWAVDMQEADAFRREQYRKHDRKNWDMEKQYSFEFESGKVDLSLEQIMSLYAYSRRETALDHLMKGGFVFGDNTEVFIKENGIRRRYLKQDATAYSLTADELLKVVDTLSAEQKAFVEEMQTYLSDVMGGKGNEVSLQMYGIKSFGEKNYFPLRSAGQYMEKAKEDSFRKEQGQISIVNSGFTKATTPHASNPITLDGFMDVWAEHVNDMAMYHGFVLPMEDFRRVYNYSTPNVEEGKSKSVNAAIENAFGKAATGYIDQLFEDLNGGALFDDREKLFRKLVGLHKKAAVFASASVVIQQPSAFVRAFALVDPRHFIGPKVNRQRHKQLWAELKKYAPVAFVKEMGYFDTGMGKSAKDFLQSEEYSGIREKMAALFTDADYRDEILGKAPALADEYTWCMIWEAVKRETKVRNPGMDTKSNAFLQIAGERFSEVIDKTQVYDSVLSRSANMRSRAEYMNMLTSFMAEPTTSINMLEDALRKGDRKQIRRTVGAVYGSVMLNALLVSLVYAARDDDEEKTFWEKYLSSVAVEVLDGINPITYYPFLRDIWSVGQGYDAERADMSLIADFANAAKNVISAGQKLQDAAEAEKAGAMATFKDSLWGLVDSMASLTGLPVKNIRRDIVAARNMYKTISEDLAGRQTTDLSLRDAVLADVMNSIPIGNLLYRKSKRDRLYGALVAGDSTYVQRLRAGYESDAAYHSAIKLALRENDSRIWEAAVAWNSGDMETYIRIAKEIRGENRFDQDDIVLAIRAEASAMEEKESASADKFYGYFTAEKFGVAIAQSNTSMANIVKQDLIDTAVVNGKTREEAQKNFRSTAKTQVKELFTAGTINKSKAVENLTKYSGFARDDAAALVAEWQYNIDYPDSAISYTNYQDWEANAKNKGVSLEVYTDVSLYRKPDSSSNTKSQEEVMNYIDELRITKDQKDALWCCFWSESTLWKATWNQ